MDPQHQVGSTAFGFWDELTAEAYECGEFSGDDVVHVLVKLPGELRRGKRRCPCFGIASGCEADSFLEQTYSGCKMMICMMILIIGIT